MDPETLSKKIRSENMSELAESDFEKNAADTEDIDFPESGLEIPLEDDDDDSLSLGYDEIKEILSVENDFLNKS